MHPLANRPYVKMNGLGNEILVLDMRADGARLSEADARAVAAAVPFDQAMALYTAKSQGRNRARGIVTVEAGDAQALIQIEADFDAACSSERVQLQTILGPEPPGLPESAAPVESAD